MKSATTRLLVGVLALLSLTYAATGVLAAPAETPKHIQRTTGILRAILPIALPDGVSDAKGKFAYLQNSDGGVDAIEIATGKTKWTTKTTAKLLRLHSNSPNSLVVQVPVDNQANSLKIAVLDSATGRNLLLSDALVFPDWVVVAAEDGEIYGKSFKTLVLINQNMISLMWNASSHYAGRAAPPPEVEEAARHNESGYFHVDLTTGRVTTQQMSIPIDPQIFERYQQIPEGFLVSTDRNYMLKIANSQAPEKSGQKWGITDIHNGKNMGEIALYKIPESFAIVGSKIFWVTSSQQEGVRMRSQTIERELTVAEIATGKVLWKRTLKPKQILALPM